MDGEACRFEFEDHLVEPELLAVDGDGESWFGGDVEFGGFDGGYFVEVDVASGEGEGGGEGHLGGIDGGDGVGVEHSVGGGGVGRRPKRASVGASVTDDDLDSVFFDDVMGGAYPDFEWF